MIEGSFKSTVLHPSNGVPKVFIVGDMADYLISKRVNYVLQCMFFHESSYAGASH